MKTIASRVAFLSGLIAVSASAQTYPPAYPRPNATRIIDNDRINAWDVTWIKDQPTPLHTHAIDQFSITLRGGLLRVSPAGGPWTQAHMSKAGSVNFVPVGTTHREEGMSDIPQHKIMLEVKPSPRHPDVHGTSPADGAVKLFENDRLIAWDLRWAVGQKIARTAQDLDTVTVFLEDGTLRTAGSGTPVTASHKAGETLYVPRGIPARVEEAVAGTPHAVIVALK
jgi:quercetin dioxygenase-like cupin family protein